MTMTDRKNSPSRRPELYRPATVADILDPRVQGFFDIEGGYWRKNGQVKTWKTRPGQAEVPVKFGLRGYDRISTASIEYYYVRL